MKPPSFSIQLCQPQIQARLIALAQTMLGGLEWLCSQRQCLCYRDTMLKGLEGLLLWQQFYEDWRDRTCNNNVVWLITLAKTKMLQVLARLRLGWQCHRSCDGNVARLREIALATTISQGLSLLQQKCRRDDNDNNKDNGNKNARIKQRGKWQWQCRWWRWCNNQTLREQ